MLSTIEIIELEKKVFKYRLKQKLYYIILGIIIFLIICVSSFLYYSQEPQNIVPKEESVIKVDTNISIMKSLELNTSKEEPRETIEDKSKDLKVEASIPIGNDATPLKQNKTLFLNSPLVKIHSTEKKINSSSFVKQEDFDTKQTTPVEEDMDTKILIRKTEKKAEETFYRNLEDEIQSTMLAPPIQLKEEDKQKSKITIESKDVNSLEYLKEKFEKTHNIIFALMLSEEYYLAKNYKESNKWALIANSIDSENEKSWIWFAKSQVKLGHKEDAIVALKAFLRNNKSKAAESLLNQMNLGEINE